MKLHALVLFFFALRITCSRCQESLSALSCAMGRNQISPRNQRVANKIFNMTRQGVDRSADGYVSFHLYTKEHPKGQEITHGDSESLKKSSFDPNRATKFITHGYVSSRDSESCTKPRDAFLRNGDYNVIVVDWWPMQSIWSTIPLDYWTVSGYVGEVGSYVAGMINFLENHGMNLETTTLIGHSLGAHVMGIAGYQARSKVNYIVGLDPALPGSFDSRDPSERLSADDATTVEVIHTNVDNCGMTHQVGHYDFYPNGGRQQPGCSNNRCSHSRVYELYTESIDAGNNGFFGRRCSNLDAVKDGSCDGDVAIMGGSMSKFSARGGMYYLQTRDSSPYALGI